MTAGPFQCLKVGERAVGLLFSQSITVKRHQGGTCRYFRGAHNDVDTNDKTKTLQKNRRWCILWHFRTIELSTKPGLSVLLSVVNKRYMEISSSFKKNSARDWKRQKKWNPIHCCFCPRSCSIHISLSAVNHILHVTVWNLRPDSSDHGIRTSFSKHQRASLESWQWNAWRSDEGSASVNNKR